MSWTSLNYLICIGRGKFISPMNVDQAVRKPILLNFVNLSLQPFAQDYLKKHIFVSYSVQTL